jgi:iron complex outermembrane receptor protein
LDEIVKLSPAFLLSLACIAPVHAEEVLELDEIEVKAENTGSYTSKSVQVGTFRDMDPIDVPLTTNVVTREVLDAQAANSIFGALRNTAGVTRSQLNGSTYDNISIRGILVENRGNYRLNGSLPIINLIDIPLENKERVEVLKGASSLYYGFVPPSGIVNMVTKRAGPEEVKSLTFSANEFGAMAAHVDYGKRFGERQEFGARINIVGGKEDIGIDNFSGHRALEAAALDWRATDNLSFKLDIEHYRKDVSEQAAIALPTAVGGRITLPRTPPAERNHAGEWQKYDAEATNVLFRTDYAINDNWSVLFEAGRAETERDRNFSQFRFTNLATGAGSLQISYTRGQEFTNDNVRTELFGRIPMGETVVNELSVGFTANKRRSKAPSFANRTVAQNYYDPTDIDVLGPNPATGSTDAVIYDRGFYLFDRILIGDKWQAMVGARASNYDSRNISYVAATGVTTESGYSASGEISPSVSLMYKLLPNLSLYASYVEGLEESGQAPASAANSGEILDPVTSKQHEFGVKTQLLSNLLLQAAYFEIERPSTFTDPTTNIFSLNGLAEYRGLEFTATGEITRQLSLAASAMLMDAEQLNRDNPTTYGKTPENTPEKTASLFAEYRLLAVPGLSLSGGMFYVGEREVNNQNQASIGGYTTYSAGARYVTKVGGERTTFQLVADNLTNKNYWSTAGNNLLGVGAPRTLKASVKIDF